LQKQRRDTLAETVGDRPHQHSFAGPGRTGHHHDAFPRFYPFNNTIHRPPMRWVKIERTREVIRGLGLKLCSDGHIPQLRIRKMVQKLWLKTEGLVSRRLSRFGPPLFLLAVDGCRRKVKKYCCFPDITSTKANGTFDRFSFHLVHRPDRLC